MSHDDDCAEAIAGLRAEVHALRDEIRKALGSELLTVGEVARYLKTTGGAVRQQIRRGQIKSVHVGKGRVRVRREDLPSLR